MKSLILKILVLAGMLIPAQYLYPQQIDLTVQYVQANDVYEVYARPAFTQNGFFLSGGSQVTVVLPATAPNTALTITSVNGGPWTDNSQIFGPAASAASDFHGIATNGSSVNFTAGTPLLLFRFSLPAGCVPGVRIFNNATDPGSGAAGLNGADFRNYLSDVYTFQDRYGTNYNNTGTTCAIVDNDNDGVGQGTDPDDANPCVPNASAALCDQDNDGLTNDEEATLGTNPTVADTDGDTINDGAEVAGGTNPLDICSPNATFPVCDQDGDGLTNGQEAALGTNPAVADTDGDGINDGAEVTGNSDPLNPCSPNPAFGTCDRDNDGLTNNDEATIGTNPAIADTDGDIINDGAEVTGGSDPLNACSPNTSAGSCDQDGDGLTNSQEASLGTNPTLPDTDGDTINDGNEAANGSDPLNACSPNIYFGNCDYDNDGLTNTQEAALGTNPMVPDTDGDTINDGAEVNGASDPLNPCSPNPAFGTCDQDADGLTNAEEAAIGTDPTAADTDTDGINDGTEVVNGSNPLDFCSPNATGGCTDADFDGEPDITDPDDANPCVPNPAAGLCDRDSDGLNNNQEAANGTNPTVADTDGDTINDGAEVTGGSDPLDGCDPDPAQGACDQDNDGLTNNEEAALGTDPVVADTDGDGINDGAEVAAGSDPLSACSPNINFAGCDQDGDGLNNIQEDVLGTDPANADTDSDGFDDGAEVTAGSDPLSACSPEPTLPTCDRDNDGLNNGEEAAIGTNPVIADTDGDGILDGTEVDNGSDPLSSCSPNPAFGSCDQDSDGLTNSQETIRGTNHVNPDTDGDGINDGAEVTAGSDPLNPCSPSGTLPTCDPDGDSLTNAQEASLGTNPSIADTDGDTLNDGAEVTGGSDPLNACSPTPGFPSCDQDGDGLINSQEVIQGTDPVNPDTDSDGINDGAEVTGGSEPLDACSPNPSFAGCDRDGDGLNNSEEAMLGTNSTVADTDSDTINDGAEVTAGSDPLNICSPNATFPGCEQDADNDGTPSTADPDDANPCVPNPAAGPCDQDTDGLTNTQEASIGTNPTIADTDGDGIPDGVENINSTDPLNACSPNATVGSCDQDGDGLTNAQELALGTLSTLADTDADGINDGAEVTGGSDPLNACSPDAAVGPCDADGDGLTNTQEALRGTNRLLADTDGDGIDDGDEVAAGSNPLNPCDPNASTPACTASPLVDFTVRFDPATCTYQVYARPNVDLANFFLAGGTQVSVVLPASVGNGLLNVTSVAGGPWSDNSQVYAPAAATGSDFHAVATNGSAVNFVAGQELLLFTFTLAGGECCADGVRLFNNDTDPQSGDPGLGGGDFNNYIADATIQDNYYNDNYDNNGLVCNPCLINPVATPTTTDTTQDFCIADAPTVANLAVNETGVVFYNAATGGTALAATTALAAGTYYAAIVDTATGCESAVRLAITVTVTDIPAPTTADTTQDFCAVDAPTVANLAVNETGVVFYTTATGGTALAATAALATGTYYAAATNTATGCESSVRLAIEVTVSDVPTPTTADTTQDFCADVAPTVASLSVNEAGVVFYTSATGGTALAATAALATGTYYAAATDTATGCESATRLAITVTVSDVPTPTTADATQEFCAADAPTVTDIAVSGTGVVFYTTPTGGTALASTTALATGTYYAAATNTAGCESAVRLAITVTVTDAPVPTTADTTQDFCAVDAPTVADIAVNETGVVFYTTPTGGTALTAATPLATGTYYAAATNTATGCESSVRLAITVTVTDVPTPTTADTTQDFCAVDAPTVADIAVSGTGVVFYTAATGGTALAPTTPLATGTYYAASVNGSCESAVRLAIAVTVGTGATPTTTGTSQTFCAADNPTVANIQVNETGVVWYTAATGGTVILNTASLVNGMTYYGSLTDAAGCESLQRLAVTVTIDNAATPTTIDTTQAFCTADSPTVADLQVNEPGVVWYASATGGTPLDPATLLLAGSTYYGSLETVAGCESQVRLAITVTINNGITPTTTDVAQEFCAVDSPTVADIQVNQEEIVFYNAPTGGTLLAATTPLTDGATYYASYTDPATGCESAIRLAIHVTVGNGTTPTTTDTTQDFCSGSNPTVNDIAVNEPGVTWYSSPAGGTALPGSTALADGAAYYASITVNGCPSAARLAVTVNLNGSSQATISGGTPETCYSEEITYTTEAGNSSYIWIVTGGDITAGGTASDNFVTVHWTQVGDGYVSVSYTDANGCAGTASAALEVDVISCADITISKTVDELNPNIGESVTFTITVTNDGEAEFTDIVVSEELQAGFNYTGSEATHGTYDVTAGVWEIPMLEPGEQAVLEVHATVMLGDDHTNWVGILSSVPVDRDTDNNEDEVTLEPSCLTVYNEFSPNGDGQNDYLIIDCIEFYPDNKLEVFNRYGSPVYRTSRYNNTWDGTANVDGVVRRDEKLPAGTYYYVLEIDGKTKTGWVYIMR